MSELNITDLDFDSIKTSLKEYLKNNSDITDYDFEGSAINILLDVLAINTHYAAYYANMGVNESFLDSAILRDSVVSHAKTLNYLPSSKTSAKAKITIQINPTDSPATIIIPENTKFNARLNGKNYSFITSQQYIAKSDDNYIVEGVELIEGSEYVYDYTVGTRTKFPIPNRNVDISTLSVRVQNSGVDTTLSVYTKAGNITNINGDSQVYFLNEGQYEFYEVYFGDGILGKSLNSNNIVKLNYIVGNGSEANGISSFTLSDSISGYSNVTITTTSAASGGAEKESINSIKFNAPKSYQAQNRAVTVKDYEAIVPKLITNAESVKVWGGQDANPPIYGRVYISIKTKGNSVLSEIAKENLVKFSLKEFNVLSVTPTIVDPEFTYIIFNSNVKYNPKNTIKTSGTIRSEVTNTIKNFVEKNLEDFDKKFSYSKLISEIDNTDTSISSNLTSIQMRNFIDIELNVNKKYEISFNNPIKKGTFESCSCYDFEFSGVTGNYFMDDDSLGNIRAYRIVDDEKVYHSINIGTLDYVNGKVNITINFTNIDNPVNQLSFIATPEENDIQSKFNQIFLVRDNDITITTTEIND